MFVWGFFGLKAHGILASWPGIGTSNPALEGKVLTTGLPGKALDFNVFSFQVAKYLEQRTRYQGKIISSYQLPDALQTLDN